MSTGRMIARAAVSAVASLALITGTGAATAFAAETTAAQQCQVETQQVKDAKQKVKKLKKKLKKAKKALKRAKNTASKADDKKAKKRVVKFKKKLKKAKANLRTQQEQKAEWCAKADQESADQAAALAAALAELQKRMSEFGALQGSTDVEALPAEVSGPMDAAFGEMLTHLGTLQSQLPAMDVAGLQSALAMLQSLDPNQLEGAIAALAAEIQAADDPSDLQALLDGLIGGLPGADAGGMEDVQAAFEALVAQLQAFDPQSAGSQLPLIQDAVTAALLALQEHSTLLQDILTALTTLNGGTMPSDQTEFEALLGTVLTALASGGSLDDVVDDLLGTILDPLDPILDPLDPVLDPLDPLLDPLEPITCTVPILGLCP